MDNPHVMSKYASELDCLRARDKWFQEQLAKCERERNAFQDQCIRLKIERGLEKESLAALQAKCDELVVALYLADYIINGNDKEGGLLYCMDGYYSGAMKEELERFDSALAKVEQREAGQVGAGETGGR